MIKRFRPSKISISWHCTFKIVNSSLCLSFEAPKQQTVHETDIRCFPAVLKLYLLPFIGLIDENSATLFACGNSRNYTSVSKFTYLDLKKVLVQILDNLLLLGCFANTWQLALIHPSSDIADLLRKTIRFLFLTANR
jgi:hypothetical protein